MERKMIAIDKEVHYLTSIAAAVAGHRIHAYVEEALREKIEREKADITRARRLVDSSETYEAYSIPGGAE